MKIRVVLQKMFLIYIGKNIIIFAYINYRIICKNIIKWLCSNSLRNAITQTGGNLRFPRNLRKRETSAIDRYHASGARVSRKTIGEQISRWLARLKSSLKFRRVVPRMLSTSNWRLTPGRRDGSSFRQIRAAMKHRISTPSVSALPTPHAINTSYKLPCC